MIVGTAGHIDHGKTALVKALTGVDTDRLKEEKARGISIELGYAYLPLKDAAGAVADAGPSILGFVDVPGHERFINTMLAGATGIDYVLLVVAADDGPMPQTREHLQILNLLGLPRGMVALTKSDAVSAERLAEAEAEVRALLAGTALAEAEILPVSALAGTNIPALRERLADAAQALPPASSQGHFRLAVDRCFTLAGAGTIVTGTAHAGVAKVGDRLLVSPSGIEVRVRSIHAQNRPAEQCQAGQRCALNITGAQLEKSDIRRGDWVLPAAIHRATAQVDVALRLLEGEERPLRHLAAVHFHLGSEHVTGRVALLEGASLEPGGQMLARISLARPIGALSGDRYIIRDAAATRTMGGGVVLDPFPPQRGRRTPLRLEALRAWQEGGPRAALQLQLQAAETPPPTAGGRAPKSRDVDLAQHAVAANLTPQQADALYAELAIKRYGPGGERGMSHAAWDKARNAVLEALRAEHKRAPGEQGPTRERLQRLLAPSVPADSANALFAEMLAAKDIASTGLALHLPAHRLALQPADVALWARVQPLLAAKPFAPPRTDQLARQLNIAEKALRAMLGRMARAGEAYAVSPDRYMLRDAVLDIAAQLRKHAGTGPEAPGTTAATMRDALGVGRNVVIEILEFFDRVGYTRRVGDTHRLRTESKDMFGSK